MISPELKLEDSLWKHAVLTGGRRNGKTTAAIELILEQAVKAPPGDFRVVISAATFKQAEDLDKLFRQHWDTYPNLADKQLKTLRKGLNSYDPYALYGINCNLYWFDGRIPASYFKALQSIEESTSVYSLDEDDSDFFSFFEEKCKNLPLRNRIVRWNS